MRITFVSPIIRAAIAALEAGFPAHVAAWNAEGENTVDLDVPAEIVFGAADVMTAYPVVEVYVMRGSLGPFSIGQTGPGDSDHDPHLTVIVWLYGETGESAKVYEQAIGYVRCVLEILAETGALGEDAEINGQSESAMTYELGGPVPVDPADKDRELRRWKVPVYVQADLAAIERWQ